MMNYSTFRLQNQGGRPAIFWEKETIPKKDRKFGYKNNNQRFPIRRYPNDKHHIDTDLVSLTPDEPPPPPKPAKNFIKRNKEKVASKKPEPPSTVTLTQEQLNAILRSVGKVAGGSENAVKITVDKHNDTKEIVIESPRRHEHDDDGDSYDDRRERRRKKRSEKKAEDQTQSIYSLLDNDSKPKASSLSDSEGSDTSIELRRLSNKRSRHRKDRKSRRRNEEDEEDEDDSRDKKTRRNKSKTLQDDIDREIENLKRRNRSKQRDEEYDSDIELKEDRIRRTRSKRQDSDIENDDDYDRDFDRKDRARKSDRTRKGGSKERTERKSLKESLERGRDIEIQNDSFNKDDEELLPSPREKIGLPMDLSWRHMTKAERRRLEAARQKLVDEEEKKEEDRIKQLNARFDPDESFKRSPQRHQQTRSDQQAVRHHIGRDTETSNYTDGNRRGRRSRSPSDQRSPDRSPDLPSYTTPDTSPKGPVGIPRRHMTLAEKKRLEWEKERVESVALEKAGNYDPWGKPGAGAPLRTRSGHVLADYKGRQVRKASYAGKVMMMY